MGTELTTGETCEALRLEREQRSAPSNRLQMVGTNIGIAAPIQIDAMDDNGRLLALPLADILARLDDFTGSRGYRQTTKRNIIECLFIAYQYSYTMTAAERAMFEIWVRDRVRGVEAIEAAKAVLLSC